MKKAAKLLKNTYGYTLVELLIVVTIFAIGIVPVYRAIISGARIQRAAEETYEATLHAQNLLLHVKKQMETDVAAEYQVGRGDEGSSVRAWLKQEAIGTIGSLVEFLGMTVENFNTTYDANTFLYEVYIWPMTEENFPVLTVGSVGDFTVELKDAQPTNSVSLIAYQDTTSEIITNQDATQIPTFDSGNTSIFTKIDIAEEIKKQFAQMESLLWAELGQVAPIGIGEITYKTGQVEIRAKGITGDGITISKLKEGAVVGGDINLTYSKRNGSTPTHAFVINSTNPLAKENVIQLGIDLTTFPEDAMVLRIENNTGATIVVPIYDEKDKGNVQIYPIQENEAGNIIVENRNKLEPMKNFIVGVIVRDAHNSTFGEDKKVLCKIVDIYSYNYGKR